MKYYKSKLGMIKSEAEWRRDITNDYEWIGLITPKYDRRPKDWWARNKRILGLELIDYNPGDEKMLAIKNWVYELLAAQRVLPPVTREKLEKVLRDNYATKELTARCIDVWKAGLMSDYAMYGEYKSLEQYPESNPNNEKE